MNAPNVRDDVVQRLMVVSVLAALRGERGVAERAEALARRTRETGCLLGDVRVEVARLAGAVA